MEHTQLITTQLIEMRSAALAMPEEPTETEYKELIAKFDTIFLGKKFNKVHSVEIAHSLGIPHEQFLKCVVPAAKSLGMELEALHALDSTEPDSTDAYYISLF